MQYRHIKAHFRKKNQEVDLVDGNTAIFLIFLFTSICYISFFFLFKTLYSLLLGHTHIYSNLYLHVHIRIIKFSNLYTNIKTKTSKDYKEILNLNKN